MTFPCDPLLCFNPNDLYPTATCAIELTLPTQDNDYNGCNTHITLENSSQKTVPVWSFYLLPVFRAFKRYIWPS